MNRIIPVVLFTYSRPDHLRKTLACLHENSIPLLYVFADGPKSPELAERVGEVRNVLYAIDWCEVRLVERNENLGLGKSILTGVTEVFRQHETAIVFEDDLICVPGTYQYLCAALEYYKDNPNVMSVTGWTHPLVTPKSVSDQPYFDGRSESLGWGTWSSVWRGMEQDALTLLDFCRNKNIDINRYGADLLIKAKNEQEMNIWSVRFRCLHMLLGGLCMRPPHSMVDHIGFDELGTNATGPSKWSHNELQKAPKIPLEWPDGIENPECSKLWRKQYSKYSIMVNQLREGILDAGYKFMPHATKMARENYVKAKKRFRIKDNNY
jgi:hypothetical protein